MAVRLKDSVLLGYARTDSSGRFELSNIPIDTMQVIISNSRFSDMSYYVFGSADNKVFDFGKIVLPPKSQQLKEVVIYAFKDPVYYKGDTLIYTADSFKVKPNATVEDLLRKLPGIKVDAQGKITSQGKEVSQVLVDGDEFFGADPTVATKNLAAGGVESVQVYEKKNENAGDGEEETTQVMNLKLKEDAKKGYFGKVSAATDAQKFYEGELLANKFKGSQKVSIFAIGSNTPKSGFGWQDMYKYGLDNEMNYEQGEDGTTYYFGNQNDKQGIPLTLKGGFYFNDKIGKKTKIGVNYTYNNTELRSISSTRSQFFLSDTSYVTDNTSDNLQRSETHGVNMKITQTLDSLTELEIEPKLKLNSGTSSLFQGSRFLTTTDTLSRSTDANSNSEAQGYNLNTSVKLTKRFKLRDRMLRVNYNLALNEDMSEGFLRFNNTFYGSATANDSIDQKKNNSGNSIGHNGSIMYTEPLNKKVRLEFEYNFNSNLNIQKKEAFNSFNGEYSIYDSTLTNEFQNNRMTNRFGIKYIYEVKKHSLGIGVRFRNVSIENTNVMNETSLTQSVNNILPYAGYNYKFSDNSRVNIKYTSNSNQPSMDQLQPIPDNSNPNSIRLGNPDLLPTFGQNINLSYNSYKPISGKYFWGNVYYGMTDNAFANSIAYDSIGRTISQTVNVNGNNNAGFYMGGSIPFFDKLLSINPDLNGNYNSYTGFINGQKNKTTTYSTTAELELGLQMDTIFFNVGYSFSYNHSSSSLSLASAKPYTQQSMDAGLLVKLPWKFTVESEAEYTITSQREEGYNLNFLIWSATVSKAFLKNENLIFSVSCNDILNQNISTQRTTQDNVITDTKTNVVGRYMLFRLTYKFNSTKTKEEENDWW